MDGDLAWMFRVSGGIWVLDDGILGRGGVFVVLSEGRTLIWRRFGKTEDTGRCNSDTHTGRCSQEHPHTAFHGVLVFRESRGVSVDPVAALRLEWIACFPMMLYTCKRLETYSTYGGDFRYILTLSIIPSLRFRHSFGSTRPAFEVGSERIKGVPAVMGAGRLLKGDESHCQCMNQSISYQAYVALW